MSDTVSQATGITGAASLMEGLLDGLSDTEGLPDEALPAATSADEAETQAEDEVAEETPPEEAATEEEAAAEDEEAPEETAPEVQLVTVKVNGKTEQLPVEEVAKGYQRQADYSQKTASLAEERRSFEAETQSVKQERAQYAQLLSALESQLVNEQPQEPDETLRATDPLEYILQKDRAREHGERIAAAQFERQRIAHLQTEEGQANLQRIVVEGRQKLVEAVPEWKNAKAWEADRTRLLDYGKTLGFTDQELGQTYDPRAVIALHKARKYDELMAKKPVPVVRQGPKPLQAGAAVTQRTPTTDATKAKQRLARTGRVVDAAAVFERFV